MEIERVALYPAVKGGRHCICGLRVTVETVLGLMASGVSREHILSASPYLASQDLEAARPCATCRLEELEEDLTAA